MKEIDLPLNSVAYEDCVSGMKRHLSDESVHLIVTSPPYFNAREYSQWDCEEDYWRDMRLAFEQCFRVLKNHRTLVLNVCDITAQRGRRRYTIGKVPLVARFTVMLEDIGFQYEDLFIWDKGEVESKRAIGSEPYPFYFKPINCYEGVLVFCKNVLDTEKIPCPICGEVILQNNGQVSSGVLSWECKNPKCRKSEGGRGVRFSKRSVMMQSGKTEINRISQKIAKRWRRDIVRINPVIKINAKGENIARHSAPFPEDIPEYAIVAYSHEEDIVLDPFIGSGTTGIAARRRNRAWLGFEVREELKEVVEKKTMRDTMSIQDFLP